MLLQALSVNIAKIAEQQWRKCISLTLSENYNLDSMWLAVSRITVYFVVFLRGSPVRLEKNSNEFQ